MNSLRVKQKQKPKSKMRHFPTEQIPKLDSLVAQLQQQIDDLTLFLEEERLNHKETKRKAGEQLKDKVDELNNIHSNNVRILQEEFQEGMATLRGEYEGIINGKETESQGTVNKMKKEIEFLQGAFESYKSQLHNETEEKWKKREEEMHDQHDEEIQKKLTELKQRYQAEKTSDRAEQQKEFQKELQHLKRENKKEQDSILRRFSDHAGDLEKLANTEKNLEHLQRKHDDLQEEYNDVCTQLTEISKDLTETKVKLIGFEEHFQDKVQEIDDKYQQQIHDLMTQNTELRRSYVQKCGELFDEKSITEHAVKQQVKDAKQTMKLLITTREKAMVSLAAGNPRLDKKPPKQKERPSSAPFTRQEEEQAQLSAGQTDKHVYKQIDKRRAQSGKPRILKQIEQEKVEGVKQDKEREEMEKFISS